MKQLKLNISRSHEFITSCLVLLIHVRQRMKEKGNIITKTCKRLTRTEREKEREYWIIKKQESRAKRSSQNICRYKEKDRAYIHNMSESPNLLTQTSELLYHQLKIPESGRVAKRKAISRLIVKLARCPQKVDTPNCFYCKSEKTDGFEREECCYQQPTFPQKNFNSMIILQHL